MLKTKALGTKKNPITLKQDGDSMLNSLLVLSKNNGFAKAKGKIGRKDKTINTKDYPIVSSLKGITSDNLILRIRDMLVNLND